MKKTISVLLAVLMTLALAACGNQAVYEAPSGTDAAPDPADGNGTTAPTDSPEPNGEDSTRVLVAYFSCTNTTKPLAEYVADGLGADLYEIVPVDPYTAADLNYNNDNSRSTKEMNDPNSRPAISGSVANMSQYDIIFVGYPIWWGEAPRIVSTFMESYDFSGKTVIPFCTSGGSGMGSSGTKLEKLTSGATWLSGRRFGGGASRGNMVSWVNSLGLGITAE
jgi:flavodoxin/predicted small lipoprotein YifL